MRRWTQQTRYTLLHNTASLKGLALEYLTRNNQGHRQKNFQERAVKKKQKTSNSTPRKPSFISCSGLGEALDNCLGPNLKDVMHHKPRINLKTFSREHPFSKKLQKLFAWDSNWP